MKITEIKEIVNERIYKCICQMIIIVFFAIALVVIMGHDFGIVGEWQSYSLATVSFLVDGNEFISEKDIAVAQEWIPEWENALTNASPSQFRTKNGDMLSWYFFTYSLACVPFMLLLKIIGVSLTKTWLIANVIFYTSSLFITYKYTDIKYRDRMLLLLLLSINPCIFYLWWPSAEVFIFSCVVMAMVFWSRKKYRLAALMASLAASLNTVLLLLCFFIGLSFLITLLTEKQSKNVKAILYACKSEWKEIILLGVCYLPAIIPLFYNLYLVGNINRVAASGVINAYNHNIFEYFLSYLFDLNYGYFPYFSFVFILFCIMGIMAIRRKQYHIVIYCITFFAIILGCCSSNHINCGMEAIARYSAWTAPVMIFTVVLYYQKVFSFIGRLVAKSSIVITICILTIISISYSNSTRNYMYFTPWTQMVLNNTPWLYSPLYVTFISRANHIDGEHNILPTYYLDENNNVKKMLVNPDCVEQVRASLFGSQKDLDWLDKELNSVTKEEYISVGRGIYLERGDLLPDDNTIWFCGNVSNAYKYVIKGISTPEELFSWTEGNEVQLHAVINGYNNDAKYEAVFSLKRVFNGRQKVIVLEDGEEIYNGIVTSDNTELRFPISPTERGQVKLKIMLPDAISPNQLNRSLDKRILAVAFEKCEISIIN